MLVKGATGGGDKNTTEQSTTKQCTHFIPVGRVWGVYCEYFGENWSGSEETLAYHKHFEWFLYCLLSSSCCCTFLPCMAFHTSYDNSISFLVISTNCYCVEVWYKISFTVWLMKAERQICISMPLLVQIMTCRLFNNKPLPEPILVYCQLHLKKQISVKF